MKTPAPQLTFYNRMKELHHEVKLQRQRMITKKDNLNFMQLAKRHFPMNMPEYHPIRYNEKDLAQWLFKHEVEFRYAISFLPGNITLHQKLDVLITAAKIFNPIKQLAI
jgi:hypothetical protein